MPLPRAPFGGCHADESLKVMEATGVAARGCGSSQATREMRATTPREVGPFIFRNGAGIMENPSSFFALFFRLAIPAEKSRPENSP